MSKEIYAKRQLQDIQAKRSFVGKYLTFGNFVMVLSIVGVSGFLVFYKLEDPSSLLQHWASWMLSLLVLSLGGYLKIKDDERRDSEDRATSASKKIAERQELLEREVANAIKRDKELSS